MHPEMDELLALRDGEGSAEAGRHAERCERCRAEIEALRSAAAALRSLPQSEPPSGAWDEIRRRIAARKRRAVAIRLGLAAAAVFVVATAVVVERLAMLKGGDNAMSSGDVRATVEQLSSASRELETVLQDLSVRAPVLTPRRAAMIVELEDRIALVDLALGQSSDATGELEVALWSDRVELLDALVAVRGADSETDGVMFAVNRNQGSPL